MKLSEHTLNLELIRSYWQQADLHWNYPSYRRPYNWLIQTLSGSGEVKVENDIVPLQKNSIVIIPLNKLCHYRCLEPMTIGACAFNLSTRSGMDIFELYQPPKTPIPIHSTKALTHIIDTNHSDTDYLQSLAAMYQLLTPVINESHKKNLLNQDFQRLEKVLTFIDINLHTHLSIPFLAETHGYSTAHFGRWFSQCVGTPPKKFINKKRIIKASKLLLFSLDKIEDIAYQCGFEDPLYFSKTFKRIVGLTPSEYRKSRKYDLN